MTVPLGIMASGHFESGGGPTFLGYRVFDGVNDGLITALAETASTSSRGKTYAFYLRPHNLGSDAELFHTPSFDPLDLYWSSGSNSMRWFDGNGVDLNPSYSMSTNQWYIMAFSVDGSGNGEIHRWVQATNTWSHSGTLGTITSDNFAASGGFSHAHDPYWEIDLVVGGVWHSALSDANIETLSGSYAAWQALSPVHLWRYDQTPVNDQAGSSDQTSLTGTTVSAGSPLAES